VTEIELHPNTMNREDGFYLSHGKFSSSSWRNSGDLPHRFRVMWFSSWCGLCTLSFTVLLVFLGCIGNSLFLHPPWSLPQPHGPLSLPGLSLDFLYTTFFQSNFTQLQTALFRSQLKNTISFTAIPSLQFFHIWLIKIYD
jgi:hypothetical protein